MAIKYIYKYIYKGDNRTILQLQNYCNKVTCYLNSYYIGLYQVVQQLYKFYLYYKDPPITRLIVYLPGEQPVYQKETGIPADLEVLQDIAEVAESTLTYFLQYNKEYTNSRYLLY